jgi:hypothetical protein
MKKIYLSLMLCLGLTTFNAQTPFWTETFGTGCDADNDATGYNPGMGTWNTTQTGNNDFAYNYWFISATEGGMGIGNCGDDCANSNNNRTLHIGTQLGDVGAAYLAGNGLADTDLRAESPIVSCVGYSNITLSFAYMLEGITGSDYFDICYSPNGGGTWTTIATPPQTNNGGCAPQGLWTGYTLTLPPSANGNPSVMVGFRWQNVDNDGADPGVAIDDLTFAAPLVFAPTFSMAASICVGGSVNVVANTNSFVVTGYTWTSSPGQNIASPNSSATAITFTNPGLTTVTLTAISGGTTATNIQTIMVNANPVLTVNASPASICGGQSTTLTVSGASSNTWNPGNMVGSTLIVTPSVTTIYTVVGTTTAGCTSTKTLNVTVGTQLSLTLAANPQTVCSGGSTTLTANGGLSYTWNPGAQSGSMIVSTPPNGQTTYTANGVNGTCTGSAVITVTAVTCVGMQQFALSDAGFKLFPNPSSDKLNISCGMDNLNAEVVIVDALGKEISKQAHTFNSSSVCTINVSTLARGIYFVKISSAEGSYRMRFVKE